MASPFVIALEAGFFIVSVIGSAVAIYELRRARKVLSDALFKKVITWMIYSSFLLAVISAAVAVNFIVSLSPELSVLLEEYNYFTFIFVLIWLTILCNIVIAMHVKEIGKTFGFGQTEEKELMIEGLFGPPKKK